MAWRFSCGKIVLLRANQNIGSGYYPRKPLTWRVSRKAPALACESGLAASFAGFTGVYLPPFFDSGDLNASMFIPNLLKTLKNC